MSYLVLARKYRPATFEEIVGQQHVTQTLQNGILKGKIHHAFLFTGTRGVGKTTTARVLAKALCCLDSDGPTDKPCLKCANCLAIAKGNSVDVHEIDGASNNSVNDIRDLRDNVQYRPQQARYKIYIIDEVHMLSTPAFNALLKTLEEPPDHVKFIFATTESHKIPQTILSRCQRYDFKAVSVVELAELFKKLLDSENVGYDDGTLQMIARMARGSVRDGLSLMDSILAYCGDRISEEDVRLVLGLADSAIFERIVSALIEKDGEKAFNAVGELVDYGHDLRQFGSDFLEYLRDIVMVSSAPSMLKNLTRPETELKILAEFARKTETSRWIAWFDLMVEGQERIARSEQARYMLELTIAKMLQLADLRPIDDLLAGVKKLAMNAARGGAIAPKTGNSPKMQSSFSRGTTNNLAGEQLPPPIDLNSRRAELQKNTPAARTVEVPENWEEIVEAVKAVSRQWWTTLMKVGMLEFDGKVITLECPESSRAYNLICDPERKNELERVLTKALGTNITVKIQSGDMENMQTLTIAEKQKADRKQAFKKACKDGENDETVQAIREVFGGGMVKVRPLTKKVNS